MLRKYWRKVHYSLVLTLSLELTIKNVEENNKGTVIHSLSSKVLVCSSVFFNVCTCSLLCISLYFIE